MMTNEELSEKLCDANEETLVEILTGIAGDIQRLEKLYGKVIGGNAQKRIASIVQRGFVREADYCRLTREKVDLFLACGVDINMHINAQNDTALIRATESGDLGAIKILTETPGINLNAQNCSGYTALTTAIYYDNSPEVVDFLAHQEGVDFGLINNDKETVLMLAAKSNKASIVEAIAGKGVDILNAKDKYDNTALILAAKLGNVEAVRILVNQNGIQLNEQSKHNLETALMSAIIRGHLEVVKILAEKEGVNFNIEDRDGKTALDLITQKDPDKFGEMYKIVQLATAKYNMSANRKRAEDHLAKHIDGEGSVIGNLKRIFDERGNPTAETNITDLKNFYSQKFGYRALIPTTFKAYMATKVKNPISVSALTKDLRS